jgi:hypothetical protein
VAKLRRATLLWALRKAAEREDEQPCSMTTHAKVTIASTVSFVVIANRAATERARVSA